MEPQTASSSITEIFIINTVKPALNGYFIARIGWLIGHYVVTLHHSHYEENCLKSWFMKKLILCLSVAGVLGVSLKIATAEETTKTNITTTTTAANKPVNLDSTIAGIYHQIDFKGDEILSFDAFKTAYHGYLNLMEAGKLNKDKKILSVADFTLSSTKHRFWIIDLQNNKVLLNDYVAHGQGSGNEFATAFSNNSNSHQSSIGFYVTAGTYVGKHGTSLRLQGMDKGYNSAAYERAVVVHGADYVNSSFVASQNRLGRSWGCPAVSSQVIGKVIDYIQGGTCLFIYYPKKDYLASSYWLNDKINNFPAGNQIQDLKDPSMVAKNAQPKYVYAENAQEYNPESPLYVSPEVRKDRFLLASLNLSFVNKVLP